MRRNIIWHYWHDPYSSPEEEFEDESEAEPKRPWDDDENEDLKSGKIRPVVPTPMGFMPLSPFQNFTKAFEFWMAHTNFDISSEVRDKIEEVEGVEILDIFTRYCFRISIGKAFNGIDVRRSIQDVLGANPPRVGEINPDEFKLDNETEEKVTLLKQEIKDKFEYWAIYVIPNGAIDVAGTNTIEGYDMHLDIYKQAQELAGGVIYTYG